MGKIKNLLIVALLYAYAVAATESAAAPETLQLVHVIFRDGHRTPSSIWKSNPYYNESFYAPYGYGQLTNEGKNTEYELGLALKKRYGEFLGDEWNIKLYDAWSTNYNRTKMSLALVLAGLFPPNGTTEWNSTLPWQPAPYNFLPVDQDKELSSYACSTVVPLLNAAPDIVAKLKVYSGLFTALSAGTSEVVDYLRALDIYLILQIQESMGMKLQNWTETVYPEPLRTFYVDFYKIETSTPQLKTVLGGYLLKKILTDYQLKVKGTLTPPERKIFLYSAHEISIALTLIVLDAFELRDCPPFGSYILFELHTIDGVSGVKIFYQDYENEEPHVITIPGCAEFCPLTLLTSLTASIMPKSDVECFGT